jgi:hypothetical protein
MIRFRIVLNVLIVTSVIGLAISYLTTLLPQALPHLNFLEAVGVYCIWTPIHHLILSHSKNDSED